jgi:hypothetical protein
MTGNIANTIIYRIRGKGRGWAFSARDFIDIGSRDAIDKTLSRLVKQGDIRRLSRGIYDYPKIHSKLGILSPSIDSIAKVIARRNNSQLKITGAEAANALGLSTQVPARITYLTDGKSRKVKVGNQTIELKHASPRVMATAGKASGTVIQALKYLGKDKVDSNVIDRIRDVLSEQDKKELKKSIDTVPDWLRPFITEITT